MPQRLSSKIGIPLRVRLRSGRRGSQPAWLMPQRRVHDAPEARPAAYNAALAIHCCELVTADADFARFPTLRWRHPFQPGA